MKLVEFALLFSVAECQVSILPIGPLYLRADDAKTIQCHTDNGTIRNWSVLTKNGSRHGINPLIAKSNDKFPGITGKFDGNGYSTVIITVNTTNMDIAGIVCDSSTEESILFTNMINITVYGLPDPPAELNISTSNNLVTTSWTYHIIPTVTVMFNISLTFLSPSLLEDITACVTDTDSYTFTLEGVRSCDPFTMCITATNTVGQSDPSCVNNSLPYIPSANSIGYSLHREGNSYSINLTLERSKCLRDNSLLYIVFIQNLNKTQRLSSTAGSKSTTVIPGLLRKSIYNLTIIFINSLGVRFSKQFCTNDVQGVTICSTMMDGVFNISCDYVSGCNYSGCSYELSSTSSYINGSIRGMDYDVVNIDISMQYSLIVTDSKKEEVTIIEQFNINAIPSCFTPTRVVPLSDARRTHTITVSVTTVFIVAITAALLIVLLVFYLFRKGYCDGCGLTKLLKSRTNREDDLTLSKTTDIIMMPICQVLEQEKPATTTQETTATRPPPSTPPPPTTTEEILVAYKAPPIPLYNSDQAFVQSATASSLPEDVMYARVGTRSDIDR